MNIFIELLAVAAGGFAGAVFRFLISVNIQKISGSSLFPYGTFAANMIGCYLIGLCMGISFGYFTMGSLLHSLIATGFLGALTTFSTFIFETYSLLKQNQQKLYIFNVAGQLLGGYLLVWGGYLTVFH